MALASQLHLGLQGSAAPTIAAFRVGPKLSTVPIHSKSRSNAAVRLQIKRKLSIVAASGDKGSNDAPQPQGPPLLTILAGVTVFLIVFWIAKSIILGLIGFLVSLIPFK